MKLYLSYYRMGDHFSELQEMAEPQARVAVISNALDYISIEKRLEYSLTHFDWCDFFNSNGFEAEELDLRKYIGSPDSLSEVIKTFQVVWVVGGNAFLLLRAVHASGLNQCLAPLVRSDQIVYGGFSAGAVVAAENLRGIELMDDPTAIVDGYPATKQPWDGLGLVDFLIVPHFQSEHEEAPAAEKAANYMAANKIKHQTLRDGEVIIVRGQKMEIRPAV